MPDWVEPQYTLGWQILTWIQQHLRQPDGPNAGDPLVPTEEQARFVARWYAVDERGRWLYRRGQLRRAKGWGKSPITAALALVELTGPCRFDGWDAHDDPVAAPHPAPWVVLAGVSEEQTLNTMSLFAPMVDGSDLELDVGITRIFTPTGGRLHPITASAPTQEGARPTCALLDEALALDTPLPTPTGWTTVADVQVGDHLIGSNGPTTVTHVTDVHHGRPCYRVTFNDGASVVADEGHLWLSKQASSGRLPRVCRTVDLTPGTQASGRPVRQSVPVLRPPDWPDTDLPLDPYVMGYWLGDGDARSAVLTVGADDLDEVQQLLDDRGIHTVVSRDSRAGAARLCMSIPDCARNRNDRRPPGVRGRLHELGVLGNKHIPPSYLRGSRQQRLDLLRGLMDSDGYAAPDSNYATFSTNRPVLRDAVMELLRSLGYVPRVTAQVDDRWQGQRVQYRVTFAPRQDCNPFALKRKADRVTGESTRWRVVVDVAPVASVPVKCIEVDAPDHLFVAGDGWLLTHNTQHWVSNNGGHKLAQVIRRNLAKSRDGAARALETTNAHRPGDDSVAEQTHQAFLAQLEGRTRGAGILLDTREAPPDTNLADEESLRRGLDVAYGDSEWVDRDRIVAEVYDPGTPPETSRRFYLNQIVAASDSWVAPAEWDANTVDDLALQPSDRVTLGFDGGRSDDATALVACRVDDGGIFLLGLWERPDGPQAAGWTVDRGQVRDLVDWAFATFDVAAFAADEALWQSDIDAWAEKYQHQLAVRASTRHPVGLYMTDNSDLTRATEALHTAIVHGELPHNGDRALARHVHNARRRPNRWGVSFGKEHRESLKKVDAVSAMVLARMMRQRVRGTAPAPAKKKTGKVYAF